MLALQDQGTCVLRLPCQKKWAACSSYAGSFQEAAKSLGQQQSSGPVVDPNLAAVSEAPNSSKVDSLLQEVVDLCAVVEHKFTTVVVSDDDYETVCNGERVMHGASFLASPLSLSLKQTDLSDESFLLHPACNDLFACLQHLHAHKQATTSAVVVLPKHPGVWRKYLPNAQLLQDLPSSDALFVPAADETMGKHAVQVYYVSPVVTDSVCAVVGAMGLTMQFHGTVSHAPMVLSMDSMCSHTLISATYARRMKMHIEEMWGLLCKLLWQMVWCVPLLELARYASNCKDCC